MSCQIKIQILNIRHKKTNKLHIWMRNTMHSNFWCQMHVSHVLTHQKFKFKFFKYLKF